MPMESMPSSAPSAGVEVAEPAVSTPDVSSQVEERAFNVDEKISLYNDKNNIVDQTKSIASGFSDPEISFKPAASESVSAPTAEDRALTSGEKSAIGGNEITDDTKSIASQFSDPETSFRPAAPKGTESVATPEQAAEKSALDAQNEKAAAEEKKIAAERQAFEHAKRIETVREGIHALYDGQMSMRQNPEQVVRSVSSNEYEALSSGEVASLESYAEKQISPDGPRGPREKGEGPFDPGENNNEKNKLAKYIGAVMYHIEPGQSLAGAKIGLIKTENGWTLPESIAGSHLSDKAQAELIIGEQTGVATNAGEKFEQTHSTTTGENGSSVETEGNYFVANSETAENSTTPDGNELKWFTVSEIQNMPSLPNHVRALISKALPAIQAKVREG